MSSNSFTWVTEGRDFGTADCGCLAGPACVCRLHTVAVRQAALVSEESALEPWACSRRCAIQIDDLYLYLYLFTFVSAGPAATWPCIEVSVLSVLVCEVYRRHERLGGWDWGDSSAEGEAVANEWLRKRRRSIRAWRPGRRWPTEGKGVGMAAASCWRPDSGLPWRSGCNHLLV